MQIILDVWEGALDIDEPLLRAEGVVGLIVRINSISGGLHLDEAFHDQWAQAANFLRAPYFVYSPWYSGAENWAWLRDHLPGVGVTRVFADVEVRKPDYSPAEYAAQVAIFHDLYRAHYRPTTYTGGWFLPVMSAWPRGDYWWGRYPYYLCPQGDRVLWTWNEFRTRANAYGYNPDPNHLCPGVPRLWQCSGDKVILPGTAGRAMDLSLFNGTISELESWWGAMLPGPTWAQAIDAWARTLGYTGPRP